MPFDIVRISPVLLLHPADTPFTEQQGQGYSAVPPPSPASFRRQQQLQHMRQVCWFCWSVVSGDDVLTCYLCLVRVGGGGLSVQA